MADLQLEHDCEFCGDEIEGPNDEVVINEAHFHRECGEKAEVQ